MWKYVNVVAGRSADLEYTQLMFTENTPMEYQPPLFSKCCEDAWFDDLPLQATVGKICTPFHNLEVEVFARNTAKNREKDVLHVKKLEVEEVKDEGAVDESSAKRVKKNAGQTVGYRTLPATNDQEESGKDMAQEKAMTKGSDKWEEVSQADGGGEEVSVNGDTVGRAMLPNDRKEVRLVITQDSDFEEIGGRQRGGTKRMSQVEDAIVQRCGREKRMRRGK